jgi:hypothetical protein
MMYMQRFAKIKKNVLKTGFFQFKTSRAPCCVNRSFKFAPPNIVAITLEGTAAAAVFGLELMLMSVGEYQKDSEQGTSAAAVLRRIFLIEAGGGREMWRIALSPAPAPRPNFLLLAVLALPKINTERWL